jgi:3-oxoacyl-[acyl-carrier-protein] synthase III
MVDIPLNRREMNVMIKAQIAGISYYLPEIILTNEELSVQFPDWSPQQIFDKTGIQTRHIASSDETALDLAVKAAKKLFDTGKFTPGDTDFVILCTQSPDYFLPTSSCLIQYQLGLPKKCGAFDFNLGCSGFVYGLALAKGLIETGSANQVLLLTSDTYSKYLHPQDKSVRTLFGDGAAATIITGVPSDSQDDLIGPFVFGTDGSGADALIVKSGASRFPLEPQNSEEERTGEERFPDRYLYMNGPAIFSFTLKVVPSMVKELLSKSNLSQENIDLFVFHQANRFMLEALCKQVKINPDKFLIDLLDQGNTVSSTIPIALSNATSERNMAGNSKAMLVGFGVGLSWAACLVTLPEEL